MMGWMADARGQKKWGDEVGSSNEVLLHVVIWR
jgi:hypothetical protein